MSHEILTANLRIIVVPCIKQVDFCCNVPSQHKEMKRIRHSLTHSPKLTMIVLLKKHNLIV